MLLIVDYMIIVINILITVYKKYILTVLRNYDYLLLLSSYYLHYYCNETLQIVSRLYSRTLIAWF